MRLFDSSENVRLYASLALSSLSKCYDKDVINRMINCGLLKTALSVCLEVVNSISIKNDYSHQNSELAENIFDSINNILCFGTDANNEVYKLGHSFIRSLLQIVIFSLQNFHLTHHLTLGYSAVNLINHILMYSGNKNDLIPISESFLIWDYISTVILCNNKSAEKEFIQNDINRSKYLVEFKLFEIIVNLFMLIPPESYNQDHHIILHIPEIINHTTKILNLCNESVQSEKGLLI